MDRFTKDKIASTITAIVFLAAFVWWERRAPRPLLPMELFGNRVFTVAIITVALVYGALMGVMFFLPQFLQLVQGDTPLQSGIAMLPAVVDDVLIHGVNGCDATIASIPGINPYILPWVRKAGI